MRLLVRAGLTLAAAAAFCVAMAVHASADVVEPSSVYQPASTSLLQDPKTGMQGSQMPKPESAQPKPLGETSPTVAEPRDQVAPATPAPEPQVRAVPAHITRPEPVPQQSDLSQALHPLRVGFREIGSYLGRVVSSCQVPMGSAAGGPVLVLGVLSMVAALIRRQVLGIWPTTDEDAPERLYATEVIKPG